MYHDIIWPFRSRFSPTLAPCPSTRNDINTLCTRINKAGRPWPHVIDRMDHLYDGKRQNRTNDKHQQLEIGNVTTIRSSLAHFKSFVVHMSVNVIIQEQLLSASCRTHVLILLWTHHIRCLWLFFFVHRVRCFVSFFWGSRLISVLGRAVSFSFRLLRKRGSVLNACIRRFETRKLAFCNTISMSTCLALVPFHKRRTKVKIASTEN